MISPGSLSTQPFLRWISTALVAALLSIAAAPASAATLTVTTLNDELDSPPLGQGTGDSLREVLSVAQDGDTIEFDPSLFVVIVGKQAASNQILLSLGQLEVTSSVTIVGPGPLTLELVAAGDPADRIMQIFDGVVVDVSGLSFRGGSSFGDGQPPNYEGLGGAISYQTANEVTSSTLSLTGCHFYDNVATGFPFEIAARSFGGALYFSGEGQLNVEDCVFQNNRAEAASFGQQPPPKQQQFIELVGGGAIFLGGEAEMTVSTTRFLSNQEGPANGFVAGGGAIHVGNSSTATIKQSTFDSNTSLSDFSGGGGIYVDFPASLFLSDSSFVANSAVSNGGGVSTVGTSEIDTSLFESNTSDQSGGGLYFSGMGMVRRSSFIQNTAAFDGGGIYALTAEGKRGKVFQNGDSNPIGIVNNTISGNQANTSGGGIAVSDGATLYNNTIINNTAFGEDAVGGGAFLFFGSFYDLNLANNIIAGNALPRATTPDTPDVANDASEAVVSLGGNLIGINGAASTLFPAGQPNANDDYVGDATNPIDPLLGPLADYGGGLPMHGTLLESLALDHGILPPATITTDQRGLPAARTVGSATDIGAYEVQDYDSDGVRDDEENTVPGAPITKQPAPIGPVADGNLDGIVDSTQDYVASIQSAKSEPEYMTFVIPEALFFSDMLAENDPMPGLLDPSQFPLGFVGFKINGLLPGDLVDMQVLFENPVDPINQNYLKVGPTTTNSNTHLFVYNATIGGGPGATFPDNQTMNVRFIDGQKGDTDLTADGVITDPGGIGLQQPLFVDLASFSASADSAGSPVELAWTTSAEIDTAGFNVYRAVPNGGGKFTTGEKLNGPLIPSAATATSGAAYQLLDTAPLAENEQRYYFLEDINLTGVRSFHGPFGSEIKSTGVDDWQLF